jgi:hypothetical protein
MNTKWAAVVTASLISANLLLAAPLAHSITLGCKKAQTEATSYLKSAYSSQNAEIRYLKRGMYDVAFSSFQYTHRWFTEWQKIVNKSPNCFKKSNYVSRVRASLKGYETNQTMASRYGTDIAKKHNYGSPDPCFKYLGEDNAYLACRIRVGEKEG